jgi:hypothetical protein
MNLDDFEPYLDPDAEALAFKLQAYLKSKNGNLLEQITLNHKDNRYYWCIMTKGFILINGNAEMYLLPWKQDDKGQYYVYSPYSFAQGAVFMVPKNEIVKMGYN